MQWRRIVASSAAVCPAPDAKIIPAVDRPTPPFQRAERWRPGLGSCFFFLCGFWVWSAEGERESRRRNKPAEGALVRRPRHWAGGGGWAQGGARGRGGGRVGIGIPPRARTARGPGHAMRRHRCSRPRPPLPLSRGVVSGARSAWGRGRGRGSVVRRVARVSCRSRRGRGGGWGAAVRCGAVGQKTVTTRVAAAIGKGGWRGRVERGGSGLPPGPYQTPLNCHCDGAIPRGCLRRVFGLAAPPARTRGW